MLTELTENKNLSSGLITTKDLFSMNIKNKVHAGKKFKVQELYGTVEVVEIINGKATLKFTDSNHKMVQKVETMNYLFQTGYYYEIKD